MFATRPKSQAVKISSLLAPKATRCLLRTGRPASQRPPCPETMAITDDFKTTFNPTDLFFSAGAATAAFMVLLPAPPRKPLPGLFGLLPKTCLPRRT